MTGPVDLHTALPDAAHEALRVSLVAALDELRAQLDRIEQLAAVAGTAGTAIAESRDDRAALWQRINDLEKRTVELELRLPTII